MTKFSNLRIDGWRQFGHIDIELHPRLTILTGANGAGKSSLLRIFSRHFGYDRNFLATPVIKNGGGYTYISGVFSGIIARIWRLARDNGSQGTIVGELSYDNGRKAKISVPLNPGVQYGIELDEEQSVLGVHIDSHAPIANYQQVGTIPTSIRDAASAFNSYNAEVQRWYHGGGGPFSPSFQMKESIISMAMFGEGNSHVQGNASILNAYKGFVDSLRRMLPDSLGFIDLSIRPPEVLLITRSGEFLIDAASGGVMSIIDLTWRLQMLTLQNREFVVTIDEPENHLHPTMQRSLLRKLLTTFPQAQFIIATHSPFMVSSVRDSRVYVLRYRSNETGEIESGAQVMPTETSRVESQKLDTINKAGSASEILREVLGVPATVPEWVEESVLELVDRYRGRQITGELLLELRAELERMGCDDLYPEALASLTERQ